MVYINISIINSNANNLQLSNVQLGDRNPSADTLTIHFDITWENSWKSKINHDAVWITVRLHDPASSPTYKKLCQISSSGLNPVGTSPGVGNNLEIYVPADKRGAFVRLADYGGESLVSNTDLELLIDYSTCGFADNDDAVVSVLGLEMVLIPEGSFYAGDYDTSTATLNQGSTDADPWYVSSESAISVTNPSSDGFRYVSGGNTGEDLTGASFTIPNDYPKGFGAFYVMKYEITEELWVEFINSLPSVAARANRDLTDGSHKNTDTVLFRNTLSCSGSPLTCSTQRSARSLSYVNWMDLTAFLDWAALRPMTELEFEKVSRGPYQAVGGEFAWGSTNITAATTISAGDETGSETIINAGAQAHYNNITLTGGDTGNGPDYQQGPLRIGIFATNVSTRESSGSGYYGIMALSGNLRERVVTIGNATGRNFTGSHGDGVLSTDGGFEGNANQADWPGIDVIPSRGVTGAIGSGFKGGGWDDQLSAARLRISDRQDAANASTSAFNNSGGRGVRTYE